MTVWGCGTPISVVMVGRSTDHKPLIKQLIRPCTVSHGESRCAHYVIADVMSGTCIVSYKSGNVYRYTNVSRRALCKLVLQPTISLGRLINWHLLSCDRVCPAELMTDLNCLPVNVPYMVVA